MASVRVVVTRSACHGRVTARSGRRTDQYADVVTTLFTTLGPRSANELGMILPHEHIFVDFRTPDTQGYAEADPSEVLAVMTPELRAAAAVGVTALVECTPTGVGRRADIVAAVSRAAGVPVVLATGIYREPWVPEWAFTATDEELESWMFGELTEHVDGCDTVAGFVKISAGDDGLRPIEERVLRAAARAAARTGALVGTHTVDGRVVLQQLEAAVSEGLSPDRFLSIHTQAIPDPGLRNAIVDRGAWIEYDDVGQGDDSGTLRLVMASLEAGHVGRMLVSHDAGWFDPAQPRGGVSRPFTTLSTRFLPSLRTAGASEETVAQLTERNPFAAFSR
jgi:phosphotriesterase-related protein